MRLNKPMIEYLCRRLAERLCRSKEAPVEPDDLEKVEKIVKTVVTENIEKEKAIEEEAHRLLKQHIKEIESQGISYHKMFQIVKQKLAKERGIVL